MVCLKTEKLHSTAKSACEALTELAHRRSLTLPEEDVLCMVKHELMLHDKNKLEKWQVRSGLLH